jgi:hypothetical protein
VNKRVHNLFLAVAMAMVICMPGMAFADLITAVDQGYFDNYPAAWPAAGPYFDRIEVSITGGTVIFSGPGLMALPDTGWPQSSYGATSANFAGWTGSKITDTFSIANYSGPSSGAAAWNYQFSGTPGTAYALDVNFFNGSTFLLHEHITFNGNYGGVTGTYNSDQSTVVPIPPTALLLGGGLLGLVGLGWRRRKS